MMVIMLMIIIDLLMIPVGLMMVTTPAEDDIQLMIIGILILMIATLIVMLVIHIFADSDIIAAHGRGG